MSPRALRSRPVARLVALSLVGALVPTGATPARAALSPVVSIVIDGRGNGHGIGVSQWGAYGWATDYKKPWQDILGFYYGGTTLGSVKAADFVGPANGRMTVQLIANDGAQTAVVSDATSLTTPVDLTPLPPPPPDPTSTDPSPTDPPEMPHGPWGTIVARPIAGRTNVYAVYGNLARTCPSSSNPLSTDNGWVVLNPSVAGPIDMTTPLADSPDASLPVDLPGLCEPGGAVRYYRGIVRATTTSTGLVRTVNDVALESYVKGVVPRESSASWADAAGGAGINALRVQAVAARSYALAGSPRASVYKTCDTDSCQVYGGAAVRAGGLGTSAKVNEDSRSNRAVDDTAGIVVRTSAGKVANTMFSSSNGGRSVSGGMYPAVDDDGDATASNPYHTWSLTVAASKVMTAWPSIGKLMDIQVTSRTGGGPWDGWINTIVLKGSTKNLTITGDDFRKAMGLRSRYLNFTLVRASSGPKYGPSLFVGDSVGASAVSDLTTMLTDGYAFSFDSKSSRCTAPRSGGCSTNNAIPSFTANPPQAFMVVELGYNDTASSFPAAIDTAMRAITDKGTTRVVWLNLSERRKDSKGTSVYAPLNAALQAATARWPQLIVLDWNAASIGDEATSWFLPGTTSTPDWVHLTSTGRSRLALFVRTQLDDLKSQGLLPPTAPAPPGPITMPVLQLGSSGPYVVQLQYALTTSGFTTATDGDFGPKTDAAVRAFQAAKGLPADGIVADPTWFALGFPVADPSATTTTGATTTTAATTTTTGPTTTGPTTTVATTTTLKVRPTLRYGSRGQHVRDLQARLKALKYLSTSVTGTFGSATRTAVKKFQKANGLAVDGIVGPKTWKALGI